MSVFVSTLSAGGHAVREMEPVMGRPPRLENSITK